MISFVKSRIVFPYLTKNDIVCISFLLALSTITRLFLINNATFLYAQDGYGYLGQARVFAHNGTISLDSRAPFVIFLGCSIKLFGNSFGELFAAQAVALTIFTLFILVVYLVGKKLSGHLLGVFAALFLMVEPIILKYSIVPYSDIFAVTMILLALYFATYYKTWSAILSILFSYIAVLTRPEIFPAIAISLSIYYLFRKLSEYSDSLIFKSYKHLLTFLTFTFLIPFLVLFSYVNSWGAFGIVQRIAIFLRPEIVIATYNSIFQYNNNQFVNNAFSVIIVVISLCSFFSILLKEINGNNNKGFQKGRLNKFKTTLLEKKNIFASVLVVFFIIELLVLTLLDYSYNWAFYVPTSDFSNLNILSRAVEIIFPMHDRYLIPLKVLIAYPLSLPLVALFRRLFFYVEKE